MKGLYCGVLHAWSQWLFLPEHSFFLDTRTRISPGHQAAVPHAFLRFFTTPSPLPTACAERETRKMSLVAFIVLKKNKETTEWSSRLENFISARQSRERSQLRYYEYILRWFTWVCLVRTKQSVYFFSIYARTFQIYSWLDFQGDFSLDLVSLFNVANTHRVNIQHTRDKNRVFGFHGGNSNQQKIFSSLLTMLFLDIAISQGGREREWEEENEIFVYVQRQKTQLLVCSHFFVSLISAVLCYTCLQRRKTSK